MIIIQFNNHPPPFHFKIKIKFNLCGRFKKKKKEKSTLIVVKL